METRRDLANDICLDFVANLLDSGHVVEEWNPIKNKISGVHAGKKWTLRLPLHFPLAEDGQSFLSYFETLSEAFPQYFLILIQAGHAALAYFEDGECLHHKVIKKYMVRGNGRAQLGYLKTRGKSKAGSRIRLANTVSFFEDINEKLDEWDVEPQATRILLSCTAKMLPMLFQSKVPPPFDKDDPRITKVPFDLQKPTLEELMQVNKQIMRGRWEGPADTVDAYFARKREAESNDWED